MAPDPSKLVETDKDDEDLLKNAKSHGSAATQWEMTQGLLYMLAGAVFFAIMALMVKYLTQFGTYELVFWRSLLMAVGSIGASYINGVNPLGPRKQWVLLTLRGILGFAFMVGYYYAIKRLNLEDAVVFNYTMPVITGIGGALLLGERWELVDACGTLLCFTGIILVSKPAFIWEWFGAEPKPLPVDGVAAAFVGAFTSAGVYLMVRMLKKTNALVFVNYFAVVGVVLGAFFSRIMGETWIWPNDVITWAKLVSLAILSILGQVVRNMGLALVPAAKATVMEYVQVVIAAVFQYVLLGKTMDSLEIVGSVMIGSWGMIALLKERFASHDKVLKVNNAQVIFRRVTWRSDHLEVVPPPKQ